LFDGVDDYAVNNNLAAILAGDFSIGLYMKDFTVAGYFMSANGASSFLLWVNSSTVLLIGNATGWAQFTVNYSTAKHYLAVHNTALTGLARFQLYIDGVLQVPYTTAGSYLQPTNTGPFNIGRRTTGVSYTGIKAWDMSFYTGIKTYAQVIAHDRTGLVGGYYCSEEAGTIGYDWSGNGNHLTLTNITAATFHAADTSVNYSGPNELGNTSYGNNLLAITNDLTSATWIKTDLTATLDNSDLPSGVVGATGFVITEDTASAFRAISCSTAAGDVADTYTASAYLKAGTASLARIMVSDAASNGVGVNIDLSTGLLGNTTSLGTTWKILATSVSSIGSGWYRLIMTYSRPASSAGNASIAMLGTNSTVWSPGYVGTSKTIRVASPTITRTSTALPYSANASTTAFLSSIVIPRNEASPTLDCTGNTLGFAGPIMLPGVMEVPCITGDGVSASVNLGTPILPSTADFSATLYYYHLANNTTRQWVLTQWTSATANRFSIMANSNGGGGTAGALEVVWNGVSVNTLGAFVAATWHRIDIVRSGTNIVTTVTPIGGSASINTMPSVGTVLQVSTELLDKAGASFPNSGAIAGFAVTTSGKTYYPLFDQCGPGSSNTNRDFYIMCSDGTAVAVASGIINGTVSTMFAARCPYAQDWCINNGGGIAANGSFVPGKVASANDAAGNAKTLSVGKHGNPYSRLLQDYWNAPSLVNIGSTSADKYAPGYDVQNESVVDTRFRRTKTDGDDRYLAARTALTGTDKTNAQAYVA
jgi:hypothetical protein